MIDVYGLNTTTTSSAGRAKTTIFVRLDPEMQLSISDFELKASYRNPS